jgi:hypothetical protein
MLGAGKYCRDRQRVRPEQSEGPKLVNIRTAWDLRVFLRSGGRATPRRLIQRRDFDLAARAHGTERSHVAERLRPDVAGAGEPRFISLRNRRAAEADGAISPGVTTARASFSRLA